MTTPDPHMDVAAYVLGILGPAETEAFEGHLLTCPDCTHEAVQLGEIAQRLEILATPVDAPAAAGRGIGQHSVAGIPTLAERQVPLGTLTPGPELLERTIAATAVELRTIRRRRFILVAAAAAAIIAGPILALNVPDQDVPTTAAPMVPAMIGQQHTAHNPVTGVTATAALQPKAWGTAITLRLSGVKGPQACQLLAVGTDGGARPVGDWTVPAPGYGVPGKPDPLTLSASTDLPPNQLDHLEIRSTAGHTLATIAT
ncbi:zf-HC2 domain-containing protein [Streptomyces sp. NBC_00233]|uniref:zf-HC2 domain-containing protein n=1 Tax=Streptomyces sp. NBC_00233 TaxID=2975686 RepID=UPI00224FBF61|nr:zf-HC2 domain-containing protein [Streptomyces sp. NBC_00233]MCX5233286.1 zf-HC2 domain-containing protein [Streptomyces sp. NBC_00233]